MNYVTTPLTEEICSVGRSKQNMGRNRNADIIPSMFVLRYCENINEYHIPLVFDTFLLNLIRSVSCRKFYENYTFFNYLWNSKKSIPSLSFPCNILNHTFHKLFSGAASLLGGESMKIMFNITLGSSFTDSDIIFIECGTTRVYQ